MVNKTILQGRLTADPELKTTQTGLSVCSFTIANSRKYKETEKTLFLRCTAWRNTAEFICRNFSKGKEIIIVGELTTEEWEDKGVKRSHTVCEIQEAYFCGSKADNATQATTAPDTAKQAPTYAPSNAAQFEDLSDDGELPF